MAIKTLNYTGRKKIYHSDVQVFLRSTPRGPGFEVQLNLAKYEFPPGSVIQVEAYRLSVWDRFSWGTVTAPRPDREALLTKFGTTEEILFRVKVVTAACENALLLGEADQLKPKSEQEAAELRVPLLPVVSSDDLGDLIFSVEFDSSRARLLVNSALGDWKSISRSDAFRALVYPAAMQQILTKALVIEREELDTDDDSPSWRRDWIRFAMQLPIEQPPESGADYEEKIEWVEKAVKAFAYRHRVLEAFQRTLSEEGR